MGAVSLFCHQYGRRDVIAGSVMTVCDSVKTQLVRLSFCLCISLSKSVSQPADQLRVLAHLHVTLAGVNALLQGFNCHPLSWKFSLKKQKQKTKKQKKL